MSTSRRFVRVDERLVHLRVAGEGPPLVLLHDAPGSSAALGPLVDDLAASHRVYAPDAPGHGLSEPLPGPPGGTSLDGFVTATLRLLDALGLVRTHLAGRGAGGRLAAALAASAPQRVASLAIDGVPLWTADQRRQHREAMPALRPRADGGHLLEAWHVIRRHHLYAPWFATHASARLSRDLPDPRSLHTQVLDLLRPGDRAADLLLAALDADPPLPADAVRERLDERAYAGLVRATTGGAVDVEDPPHLPPQPAPAPGRITRRYLTSPGGQLHVRESGSRGTRPLLVLHQSPGSAASLEPIVAAFGRDRRVVAPDTIGNGDSDRPPGDATPDIGWYADVLAGALDDPSNDLTAPVDVWGSHTGALIGLELAVRRPDLVRRLGLDGITMFDDAETRDILANYFPSLTPDTHGLHLVHAWHVRLDMSLWWPWYRHLGTAANRVAFPDPEVLHPAVLDLLVTGETWHLAYRAAFAYPTRERVPLLEVPTLLGTAPGDPLGVFSTQAAELNPRIEVAETAGTRDAAAQEATAGRYAAFFAGR